ncbi:MAG TPA: hypothetical protein VNT20_18395 [Flavisolibacter sp.]|jgi:hypothetical protein|nr:hypothetical protein [Flavisolibacter sp.]
MTKTFDTYVINSILLNNEFHITEVREIIEIRTMIFERAYYQKIADLITKKNIDIVKSLPEYPIRTSEYVTIMKVVDQDGKKYIVTVYDSDEITQDPQVIDIFPQ